MHRTIFTGVILAGLATSTLLAAGETSAKLLKQARISRTQAEQIALAQVPKGKIQSAEIENEHALVWSFDIVSPNSKNITEAQVDAKTGAIADLQVETPKDQAKEAAVDKKAAGKK